MGIRTPGLVEAETWMSPEEAENMVNDLRRQPMVENATRSMHGVLGEYWTRGLIDNSGKRIETLMYNPCDKNYAETMGITIIEGKDMQNEGDVLVNEEVVRLMKWTDGAVGKRLNDFDKAGTIVGVFRNVAQYVFFFIRILKFRTIAISPLDSPFVINTDTREQSFFGNPIFRLGYIIEPRIIHD